MERVVLQVTLLDLLVQVLPAMRFDTQLMQYTATKLETNDNFETRVKARIH